MHRNFGLTRKSEEAAAHREQSNGLKADQTRHEKRNEEKTPARKWYETTFARIGQGVCIAALMWLLFLYLKRKREPTMHVLSDGPEKASEQM